MGFGTLKVLQMHCSSSNLILIMQYKCVDFYIWATFSLFSNYINLYYKEGEGKILKNNCNTKKVGTDILLGTQESKGIRQWPINWWTCTVKIHKIVNYNTWLKRYDTQLMNQPIKNQLKSSKLLNQPIKNVIIKLWGLVYSTAHCPHPSQRKYL